MQMVLGSYTFAENPDDGTPLITGKRSTATVETVGGVEFFSWGLFIAGKEYPLKWTYMSSAMFTELETMFAADAPLPFDPRTGKTYQVEITDLTGDFYMDQNGDLRKNVVLSLLILSEDS